MHSQRLGDLQNNMAFLYRLLHANQGSVMVDVAYPFSG